MQTNQIDQIIRKLPALGWIGKTVSSSLHRAVLNGSEQVRTVADFLHGTWLKHPLHPVLTDVTLGAWMFGGFFDLLGFVTRSKRATDAADMLTAIGTASAVPTALSGLADYSTIKRDAMDEGTLHGVTNMFVFLLFVLSSSARLKGKRARGIFLSGLGLGIGAFSAWLGGELVYKRRVGVNHSTPVSTNESWLAVLPAAELAEHETKRVDVNGTPIVLYRYGGTVYAFGAVCSHAGGPLEKGTYHGYSVQCPWHDSVFDVREGCVLHGPATQGQPAVRVRVQNGQIEVYA